MSYHTTLQVQVFAPESFDIDNVAPAIREFLDQYKISHQVLDLVKEAFRTGEALIKLHGEYVVAMVDVIHRHAPEVDFCARGWGEEPDDFWIRSYNSGNPGLVAGPFELSKATPGVGTSEWLTRSADQESRPVLVRPRYAKILFALLLGIIIVIAFWFIGRNVA